MIIESFFKMQTIKQRVNCLMWALSTRFKEVCLPSLFFHEVPFRHGLITPPTSPPQKKQKQTMEDKGRRWDGRTIELQAGPPLHCPFKQHIHVHVPARPPRTKYF